MPAVYFSASFGGIPLLIAGLETERGRDIAVQSPSIGERHTLRDRGRRQVSTRCEVVFCDQPGLAPYTERYQQFRELCESPEPQIFSHPLDGSARVLAADLQVSHDNTALEIRVHCTLHEESVATTTLLPVAGGTNPAAGVESVAVAAAAASATLADLGIASDFAPALAAPRTDGIEHSALAALADTVAAWRDAGEQLDSHQVFLEVADAVRQLDELTETLELVQDISRWQAYRNIVLLRFEVARAGEAFTATARSTFDVRVDTARPVLAICAEIYGAAAAPRRADEVTRNNRIRTPGLVPAGTLLKMPAVTR